MGGIYKYDIQDLGDTVTGLATLKSDFDNASTVQEESSDAFGYSGLAGAVEEFVDNWKANRDKTLEVLEATQTALADITDNYIELDEDGVATLTEPS